MELLTSEILKNNNICFKVLLDKDNLKIIFSNTFWLHPEAVETIQYFMSKIKEMKVSDSLVRAVTEWFNGFLSACFCCGMATTTYIVDFIKIEGVTE